MQAYPLSSPAARNRNSVSPPPPPTESGSLAEGVGLAHDAGNLLGALGLYCDLLAAPGVLRPEHLHYARELRTLSQRSGSMIQRLMKGGHQFASGGVAPARCTADVVRALVPLLRSIAQPDAAVIVSVPGHLPALPFACEILERILVNLTRNAATALRVHRGGEEHQACDAPAIRIDMQSHTGSEGECLLRLTVADNGPGMPLAVAGAFLKPKPMAPGALRGFGHRIVRELLQTTGGALKITVAPGRGTTLTIDWNVAPPTVSATLPSEATC